ncbi:MAG TPA: beta-L-arabinofuranosidase domain-containing protein, partial [Pirellulales bacterium]|nr:beta-L-arabinofuranosidase domain-containing protein [Pirellulales bacterium]
MLRAALPIAVLLTCSLAVAAPIDGQPNYANSRAPLSANRYIELPLGTIKPRGWLKEQLDRMARGMTGQLDALYPEVVGPRNGWLGGDGDGWERGPYWIDGLVPLAYLLDDAALHAKARPWIEWMLTHQGDDGYFGPVPFDTPPPEEPGLQKEPRRDWWPKMVMLKVLMQHYGATGDERVIPVLTKYFRYQLRELPKTPLNRWTAWARMRGGENLMAVYWLYNLTGEKFLLELGDLLYEQTHPFTDSFLARQQLALHRFGGTSPHGGAFHCVDLAQGIKTPIIRWQADQDPRQLRAVKQAFDDIERWHGQPHGLYGGDEGMHGRGLTRGSELCTAVEMMFSLEKMLEITGDLDFADRLEQIAFNVLPTQASDDYLSRQYFQQSNQVACTLGDRNFFNDEGDRIVFGLLSGYPCCTCNMHQGWPKFVQHLWMASADGGLAALAYGPSSVTAKVADGQAVTIVEETHYPFDDQVRLTISTGEPITFPLHLRVPGWCDRPSVSVNGEPLPAGD